jgi:small subunit ribosomal protein S4
MILKRKHRFKPLYKQFLKLRENVQNRHKLLKFKKQKWEKLIQNYKRKLKQYKKFKPQDQNQYLVSKYPSRNTSYQKRYRNTLHATKRLALYYGGLSRKFIKSQVEIAYQKRGIKNINQLFLELFESRLDTVLYRAKFSPSIRNARQLIVHGKISINNRPVKSKFYSLKPGDLITINPKYAHLIESNIRQALIWPIPPKHLFINYKTMQVIFGDIKNTNLSTNFPFNLNLEKVLVSYKSQ